MTNMLHELLYKNTRNYGRTVHMGSCRTSIIDSRGVYDSVPEDGHVPTFWFPRKGAAEVLMSTLKRSERTAG